MRTGKLDEKGRRETLLVVLSYPDSMLVEHPKLCACMKIRRIGFRVMAER